MKVAPAEMAAFKAAAEELGLTVSAWARVLLRRAAGLKSI